MYPHQVLMEENDLTKKDLSKEAQGFVTDFNHKLNAVNMKVKRLEKQGKEAEVTEEDMAKLNRLSKSVVFQIYSEMKEDIERKKNEKLEEVRQKEEALKIKKQQEEEEIKAKEELEARKRKIEEDAIKEAEDLADKIEEEEKQEIKIQEESRRKEQEQQEQAQQEQDSDLFNFFF
jgi:hypothetical protein